MFGINYSHGLIKETYLNYNTVNRQRTSKPWGLIILDVGIGVVVALTGIIIGLSSHQVEYQLIRQGNIDNYILGDGIDYLELNTRPSLFILTEADFTPKFNNNILSNSTISLVYKADDTTDINVTSLMGTHLIGKAYKVVEIADSTNEPKTYITSQYTKTPMAFIKITGISATY